ncbi:hypothetical protein KAT36_02280 [Candidatus Pacearchaeota archaeon]|nr:hypothetical protein [Candidatus Pacearchaeota archaeon]
MTKRKGHAKGFITGLVFLLLGVSSYYILTFRQMASSSPNPLVIMGGMYFGGFLALFGFVILGASLVKWLDL